MIDIFGRSIKARPGKPGAPGIGFNLNSQGDFDLKNKKLTNVKDPQGEQDAATQAYVKRTLDDRASLNSDDNSLNFNKRRLINIDSPKNDADAVNLTHLRNTAICFSNGSFDARDQRLSNVKNPTHDLDAVNAKIFYSRSLCCDEIENNYGDREWLFDAKHMRISNLGDTFFTNDAVSGRILIEALKLTLKLIELELADFAIALRQNFMKKPDKNLQNLLNSISSSVDRSWRGALQIEEKAYSYNDTKLTKSPNIDKFLDDFVRSKTNSSRTLKTLSKTLS